MIGQILPSVTRCFSPGKRQFVYPTAGPRMFGIEGSGATILIEVPGIQSSALGVGGDIHYSTEGVGTQKREAAGEAFGRLDLQCIVCGPTPAFHFRQPAK